MNKNAERASNTAHALNAMGSLLDTIIQFNVYSIPLDTADRYQYNFFLNLSNSLVRFLAIEQESLGKQNYWRRVIINLTQPLSQCLWLRTLSRGSNTYCNSITMSWSTTSRRFCMQLGVWKKRSSRGPSNPSPLPSSTRTHCCVSSIISCRCSWTAWRSSISTRSSRTTRIGGRKSNQPTAFCTKYVH